MVLYYGLFALEAANSTVAAAATRTKSAANLPRVASDRSSLPRKQTRLSNSVNKMPSSSLSSSNSWIYTEDLRKRFEERYADYRYVFVPVYIDRKSAGHSHSTTGILQAKADHENAWMYSRSLRDHLCSSTSKMSLPLTTNRSSSSSCSVTNHGFTRDELPVKKDFKSRLFRRSLSTKEKTTTNMSLSSSISSFSTANNLVKHRTSDVVEEEDEGVDNENHSIPLIKHDSTGPPTSRPIDVLSIGDNMNVNPTTASDLANLTSASSIAQPSIKHTTTRNKKLTRLRSFFFRTSSTLSPRAQQQQQTTLSNQISRT